MQAAINYCTEFTWSFSSTHQANMLRVAVDDARDLVNHSLASSTDTLDVDVDYKATTFMSGTVRETRVPSVSDH